VVETRLVWVMPRVCVGAKDVVVAVVVITGGMYVA